MTDPVEKIAAAVLYEGYVLWPYRRSAQKNQRRWTFGGVYPRAYSEAEGGNDPWLMQTQCLVIGEKPTVEVKVRFLHVVERKVAKLRGAGTACRGGFQTRPFQGVGEGLEERLEFVDELRVGDGTIPRLGGGRRTGGRRVGPRARRPGDADAHGDLGSGRYRRGAAGRRRMGRPSGRWCEAGTPWKARWR